MVPAYCSILTSVAEKPHSQGWWKSEEDFRVDGLGVDEVGRVQMSDIPLAFAAGSVGEEARRILFCIAAIVGGERYDFDVSATPCSSTSELPRAH